MYIYIYTHSISIYIYIYVCVYTYTYIYIYIYIYTHTSNKQRCRSHSIHVRACVRNRDVSTGPQLRDAWRMQQLYAQVYLSTYIHIYMYYECCCYYYYYAYYYYYNYQTACEHAAPALPRWSCDGVR